eukprot:Partr_v1_DN21738_c0_g1_i1_m7602 putative RNA polymerase II
MFFLKSLEHRILLHPSFFGGHLREFLRQKLHEEVEGTCSGRYGYIIAVASVEDIGSGRIQEGIGSAEYNVTYKAIVFKPFKGEVLDARVTIVNKMGFFAEAGPLTVFVSNHLIPEDMEFDSNSNPPCYQTDDQTVKLEKDEWVRVKIVGTRVDATEIFAIGTIKEDYLGVI